MLAVLVKVKPGLEQVGPRRGARGGEGAGTVRGGHHVEQAHGAHSVGRWGEGEGR